MGVIAAMPDDPRRDFAQRLVVVLAHVRREKRRLRKARSKEGGVNPHAPNRDHRLTPTQLVVLQRVAAGDTNDEIAARLEMAVETAKSHVKAVLQKLGAKNRTHAVWRALELGLIAPPRTEGRLSPDPVPSKENTRSSAATDTASSPSTQPASP